jgi:hypothetical protein
LNAKQKAHSIDLGLAILHALHQGERFSCADIAAWCDCSPRAIYDIEQRALGRVRKALKATTDGDLSQIIVGS